MVKKVYDVIIVEDDLFIVQMLSMVFEKTTYKFKIMSSLEELEKSLKKEVSKIYVLDGNFPKEKNSDNISFLFTDAVELILKKGEFEQIISFSSDSNDTINNSVKDLKVNIINSPKLAHNLIEIINELYQQKKVV